jgi:maltodextrin utilization protein YvdJ
VVGFHSPLPLDRGLLVSARALNEGFNVALNAATVPVAAAAIIKFLRLIFFLLTFILLPLKN